MPQQGMFGVLKFQTDGFDGSAGWNDLSNVRDVETNFETGETDVTTRANQGWRAYLATLKEATVEFEMNWEPGDDGFEAIKNAWLAGTTIGLAVLDREGSSGEGPVGNFAITNFSRSEQLEEAMRVSVTARLSEFGEWTTTGVT